MIRCTRCNTSKSADEFRWMPSRGSYHSWCRECERAHRRSAPRRSTSRRGRGRAFGIEIELTGPGRDIILGALRGIGIDANSTGYRATNGSRWELKSDCSVGGHGLELVSPKLYGTAGIAELERVLAAINSVGATVNRTCGVHVHIDFRNRTVRQIKDAIRPILRSQDAFYQMVAPSRRTNHYSAPWTQRSIDQFDNTNSLQYLLSTGPRGFVNLGSYTRHGSIEFRSHGASTNFTKLSAWVALLFAAVEYGERHGESANLGATAQDVVDTLGLAVEHKTALLRFVRAAEALEDAECATVGA
jgi:hypothetical protein